MTNLPVLSDPLPGIALRRLQMPDTAVVAEVGCESGDVDRNSTHFYALSCTHFADTAAVAVADHRVVGFVAGH